MQRYHVHLDLTPSLGGYDWKVDNLVATVTVNAQTPEIAREKAKGLFKDNGNVNCLEVEQSSEAAETVHGTPADNDLYNPIINGPTWQEQTKAFATPKTDAMYRFLDTEVNNRQRVTGLSIEPDGVFIYTDSDKWCDDAGAGTFRGDSESAAIRRFRDQVKRTVGETNAT